MSIPEGEAQGDLGGNAGDAVPTGAGTGTLLPNPPDPLQPPDLPALLASLPRWQREYLSARAAGRTDKQAAIHSRSSTETIQEWLAKSRARVDGGRFWYAYSYVVDGVYIAGGPEAVRARHLESADAILDHFTKLALGDALDGPVRHRDQIGAGDRVLAATGLTGQGARVAIQVNTTLTLPPNRQGAWARSPRIKGVPTSPDPSGPVGTGPPGRD